MKFALKVRVMTVLMPVALVAGCGSNAPGSIATSDGTSQGGAAGAAGLAKKDAALADRVPAAIKQAGIIRMAINPSYPPFESTTADNKLEGLDPDLATAIAETLGLRIEFVPTSFDAIIPALQAQKVDMAMSSIGDTKAREQVVDFTTYYWNGTMVLVGKGNPKGISAEMACGSSIGVIRGSLQQSTFLPAQGAKCQAAGKPEPVTQAFQDGPQAQLALRSQRIDGVMLDAPPLLDAAKKNPQVFEVVGPLVRNPNPGGVAFPKGSALAPLVNEAINKLIANGAYATVLKKWNLEAIKIAKSQVNGAVS